MRGVFLLGCERSGSTWLSNIFDAHPDVELLMEPFADYAQLFPEVPDRNAYVGEPSAELCAAVRAGYRRLPSIKHPMLYRPGRPVWLRRWEQVAVRLLQRSMRRALGRAPRGLERYLLLQLNTLETPVRQLTRKNRNATLRVTKELRLNFKIPLLREAFPEASFVVVLRDPGAQIASVLGWMRRGRLGELRRALTDFQDRIAAQERFEGFARTLSGATLGSGTEQLLAAWWAINYSVLLSDLERCGAEHAIVRHERLSEQPTAEAERLLSFARLSADPAVERYVAWSREAEPRGDSPTETVRRSAEHARRAIREVPTPVRDAVHDVLTRLRDAHLLHECLTAGFETLGA